MGNNVAIIAAAGQGKRMGSKENKQYLPLLDRPILAHTLQAFQKHPHIHGIIVIAAPHEVYYCQEEIIKTFGFTKVLKVVAGGKERQDSIFRGLQELSQDCELVVVHDGARPLITPDIIDQALEAAALTGGAVVAVPVKDTIKRVDELGVIQETLVRSELWSIQTPQVFKKNLLIEAYENAFAQGIYGTDDASLVERLGEKIKVVKGSYENIKITTPEDMELAAIYLRGRC